ncbi:hypothetical protein F5878DRAFT_547345, partial [Lentinula raphanica]
MERNNGVGKWAEDHNCEFGFDKFKLVDFTRQRERIPGEARKTRLLKGPGVQVGNNLIAPVTHARFLGVQMDGALRWKEQQAIMVKRGQEWLTQFRRLARSKDGMAASHIRQLYKAKALPRILYAADV